MNNNDLIQVAKIIKLIVEKEVQKNIKPLLNEIRVLNNKLTILNENNQSKNQIVKKSAPKYSINDILSDIVSSEPQVENTKHNNNVFDSKKNPMFSIFEDITPFGDEPEVESILDLKSNSNDAASKILNKLQNTDFKRTLQIMEQSANRNNF